MLSFENNFLYILKYQSLKINIWLPIKPTNSNEFFALSECFGVQSLSLQFNVDAVSMSIHLNTQRS